MALFAPSSLTRASKGTSTVAIRGVVVTLSSPPFLQVVYGS
jgi:hypothetical protein